MTDLVAGSLVEGAEGKDVPLLAADLLNGALAISKFMGWSRRQTYYAIEKGCWPIFRIGGVGSHLIARKSSIIAHIAELERKATNGGAK